MNTLALVMIVKNEARCLEKCLARLKDMVDEIYITDTGSTDSTVEIAQKFGAHISHYTWKNDFADARNYSLSQSPCDWNLVVDADEYLVEGTRKDLEAFLQCKDQIGAFQRNDTYVEYSSDEGDELGVTYTYTARLLPRGIRFTGKIHEQADTSLPIRPIPLVFEHDGYLQGGKGERNLEILLKQYEESPHDPYVLFQLGQSYRILKNPVRAEEFYEKFYKEVPVKGAGYRPEGVVAYLYTLIENQNFDRGLEIIQNEGIHLENNADFHFVCGIFYMKAVRSDTRKYIALLPRIEQSYLRCLEIGEVPLQQGVAGCGSFKAAYNLGTWYEVSGNMELALRYYRDSAAQGYTPAVKRLHQLGQ